MRGAIFPYYIPTAGTHRYWRIHVKATNSTQILIAEVEMYDTLGGSDLCTGGTASATSDDGTNVASRAFADNGETTYWQSAASVTDASLVYDFGAGNEKEIKALSIQALVGTDGASCPKAPKDFDVDYSDNGTDWITAWAVTGLLTEQYRIYPSAGLLLIGPELTPTDGSAHHWRLNITANNGEATSVALMEVEMMTTRGGTNECTGGRAAASAWYDTSYTGAKAFDGDTTTTYNAWDTANSGPPQKLYYTFTSAKDIVEYALWSRDYSATRAPKNWTLEKSPNGWDWYTVDTRSNWTDWVIKQRRRFVVGEESWLRLYVTANDGHPGGTNVSELEVYETAGGVDIIKTGLFGTNGSNAWALCDDSIGTWWTGPVSDAWVYARLGWIPEQIQAYHINGTPYPTSSPKDFKLDLSTNNGTSWTTIDEQTGITGWGTNEEKIFTLIAEGTPTLVVANSTIAFSLPNVTVASFSTLAPNNVTVGLSIGSVVVEAKSTLAPASLTINTALDNLVLDFVPLLQISNFVSNFVLPNLNLGSSVDLLVADVTVGLTIGSVVLEVPAQLVVENLTCSFEIANTTVIPRVQLVASNITISFGIDSLQNILPSLDLVVAGLTNNFGVSSLLLTALSFQRVFWTQDRTYGPWNFVEQPDKFGYINNPFWAYPATENHMPCGYWFKDPQWNKRRRHGPWVWPPTRRLVSNQVLPLNPDQPTGGLAMYAVGDGPQAYSFLESINRGTGQAQDWLDYGALPQYFYSWGIAVAIDPQGFVYEVRHLYDDYNGPTDAVIRKFSSTHQLIWTQTLTDCWCARVFVDGDKLYLGGGNWGMIYSRKTRAACLNILDGTIVWDQQYEPETGIDTAMVMDMTVGTDYLYVTESQTEMDLPQRRDYYYREIYKSDGSSSQHGLLYSKTNLESLYYGQGDKICKLIGETDALDHIFVMTPYGIRNLDNTVHNETYTYAGSPRTIGLPHGAFAVDESGFYTSARVWTADGSFAGTFIRRLDFDLDVVWEVLIEDEIFCPWDGKLDGNNFYLVGYVYNQETMIHYAQKRAIRKTDGLEVWKQTSPTQYSEFNALTAG